MGFDFFNSVWLSCDICLFKETMEDWDQETLEKVVESKKSEYKQNKPTDIVSFLYDLFVWCVTNLFVESEWWTFSQFFCPFLESWCLMSSVSTDSIRKTRKLWGILVIGKYYCQIFSCCFHSSCMPISIGILQCTEMKEATIEIIVPFRNEGLILFVMIIVSHLLSTKQIWSYFGYLWEKRKLMFIFFWGRLGVGGSIPLSYQNTFLLILYFMSSN